mmetsp:Transcript_2694/g.4964  ORF Transcript_2694/g.4964 Transcript_2694/m.4964 type:complete len:308 (-) Transcript_2694:301-1224(-)
MLGSHPKLTDYAEIFLHGLPGLRRLAAKCHGNEFLTEEGSAHARSFLEKTKDLPDGAHYEEFWEPAVDMMSHFTNGNEKAVGFKWMMNQGLDNKVDEAIDYFNENNFKVVILDRQNLLRQCISGFQLRATGEAHIMAGHENDENTEETFHQKLNITARNFRTYFKNRVRYHQWYDKIEAEINPGFVTRVTYSELSDDPVSVVKRLHKFFGLDSVEIETGGLVKSHVGPVSDFVEDWENVRAELLKTEYADAVKHWEDDSFASTDTRSTSAAAHVFIPEHYSYITMNENANLTQADDPMFNLLTNVCA